MGPEKLAGDLWKKYFSKRPKNHITHQQSKRCHVFPAKKDAELAQNWPRSLLLPIQRVRKIMHFRMQIFFLSRQMATIYCQNIAIFLHQRNHHDWSFHLMCGMSILHDCYNSLINNH